MPPKNLEMLGQRQHSPGKMSEGMPLSEKKVQPNLQSNFPAQYQKFVDSLVGLSPQNLTKEDVAEWSYDWKRESPRSLISEDILKKRNNFVNSSNVPWGDKQFTKGIKRFTKTNSSNNGYNVTTDPASPSNTDDYTNLNLGWKGKGPLPNILTHEAMHENDHQQDNLNKKVWEHLNSLYNASKPEINVLPNKSARQNTKVTQQNSNNFANTLQNIQKKLSPSGLFSDVYSANKKFPEVVKQINGYILKVITGGRFLNGSIKTPYYLINGILV
jgi:hypothetical protein